MRRRRNIPIVVEMLSAYEANLLEHFMEDERSERCGKKKYWGGINTRREVGYIGNRTGRVKVRRNSQ